MKQSFEFSDARIEGEIGHIQRTGEHDWAVHMLASLLRDRQNAAGAAEFAASVVVASAVERQIRKDAEILNAIADSLDTDNKIVERNAVHKGRDTILAQLGAQEQSQREAAAVSSKADNGGLVSTAAPQSVSHQPAAQICFDLLQATKYLTEGLSAHNACLNGIELIEQFASATVELAANCPVERILNKHAAAIRRAGGK